MCGSGRPSGSGSRNRPFGPDGALVLQQRGHQIDLRGRLFPGSGAGRPVVGRRSDVGQAHAAHDVLDHVDVALATIEVDFASLSPPVSSCVVCHSARQDSHHGSCQRLQPNRRGVVAGQPKSVVARPRTPYRSERYCYQPGPQAEIAAQPLLHSAQLGVVHLFFRQRTRKSGHNPFMPTSKLYGASTRRPAER